MEFAVNWRDFFVAGFRADARRCWAKIGMARHFRARRLAVLLVLGCSAACGRHPDLPAEKNCANRLYKKLRAGFSPCPKYEALKISQRLGDQFAADQAEAGKSRAQQQHRCATVRNRSSCCREGELRGIIAGKGDRRILRRKRPSARRIVKTRMLNHPSSRNRHASGKTALREYGRRC